ncbi:MAG: FAD-dependent oxidoreductase [Pyrinomonadaceae bacterium]|nr:FAD-dependent oxidoreductase [Pyrinomonadaceae bacterium]
MFERRNPPNLGDEAVKVVASFKTACCVVGAGPGGAILSLLLARQGIPVILLEAHEDFDRDFRGDTIHPSVLHLMDELGLAERLLQLRHSKLHTATIATPDGPITVADFKRVDKKFPFIMMVSQAHFLEFITNEAKRYPSFHLLMGASVQELIEEDGTVRGVRYRAGDGWHEVRATLTVGADGRSSRIRKLAGFVPIKTSPPMDILWFRIPRKPDDPEGLLGYLGRGHGLVLFDRLTEWQAGFIIIKGSYSQIRTAGLEALRKEIAALMTMFPDRIEYLQDWKQVSVLSVESSRMRTWYKPGLLLIGDAAHVMSPVGGVGINYAIQDAVVAANVLTEPLKAGRVTTDALAEVQKQREFPTKVIQWIQAQGQKRVITAALRSKQPLRVPWFIRLLLRAPFIGDLPARVIAHGVKTVHITPP